MKSLLLFTLLTLSPFIYSGEWFTENIGQIKNSLGEPNNDVLYIYNGNGLTVTLRNNGFSYEVKKITSSTADLQTLSKDYKFHASIERIDFEFSDKPTKIITDTKSASYSNVYSAEGNFENISNYKKIIYKDIAQGIDIEFVIKNGQFKYNLLVTPKADLSKFFVRIKSEKTPSLNNGKLILNTIHGELVESIPLSYLNNSKKETEVNYKLIGRKLSFETNEQQRDETLIIDPVPDLIWNTYFGGSQYDLVNDIALNDSNKIYQTGFTMSLDNISTSGAFLENYQGDLDAFVSKFDLDGNIIWSTYYAGPQTERVYNIALDTLGNCYIAGSTFSTTGIATTGVHQQYIDGADDIFYLKLFSNGQRDWCTYHGGNGHDFITDILIINDTIFSVGHTTSTNNLASSGAHLENNTTSEAGHITLFSVNGDFLWGTYFGDGGNNSVEGVVVNNNSIYITGRSNNSTGISTSGTHQESLGGFVDGFISKFNKAGSQIWGTYFGGDYTDVSNGIALDENGNIYICGDASSLNQISTPGAHQENRLSAEQGFLSKFSSDGQQIWGTYTGGYSSDYLHKIDYKNGFIYIGGQTLSETDIVTSSAFQQTKSDGYDIFLQKFDTTGLLQWGTYFGDIANEDITSLVLSNDQQIIISGNGDASSMNFTTVNAYQEDFGGGTSDGFISYFCQPIKPQIDYSEGQLISTNADEYDWYFEGSPLNEFSQAISPSDDGEYYVITSNNGLCPDTSEVFDYSTIGIEKEIHNSIKTYPNPTSSIFNIKSDGFTKVVLYDVNNKIIESQSGFNALEIDLSKLSKGLYIIHIDNKNESFIKKIIKY